MERSKHESVVRVNQRNEGDPVQHNAEFSQLADVTIITKSGANIFHGSAFEYLQNSALDATAYGFDSKAHKLTTLSAEASAARRTPAYL